MKRANILYFLLAVIVLVLAMLACSLGSIQYVPPNGEPTTAARSGEEEIPSDTPEEEVIVVEPDTDTPLPPPTDTLAPTDTEPPADTVQPSDTPAPTDTLAPTDTPQPTATVQPACLVKEKACLYYGPGTDYEVVRCYLMDVGCEFLGRNEMGDWFKVKINEQYNGWVYFNFIKTSKTKADVLLMSILPYPPAPTKSVIQEPCQRPNNCKCSAVNGETDWLGECQGNVLIYCDGCCKQRMDCAAMGGFCGWLNDNIGNVCFLPDQHPTISGMLNAMGLNPVDHGFLPGFGPFTAVRPQGCGK
jgi:hypothetical protein